MSKVRYLNIRALVQWKRFFYAIRERSEKSVSPKEYKKFSNLTILDLVHKITLNFNIVVLMKICSPATDICFYTLENQPHVIFILFIKNDDKHIKRITLLIKEIKYF